MAWGDNRNSVIEDTFDSEIAAADWTNGYDDYDTFSWVTGGYVQATNYSSRAVARHDTALDDKQYALVEIQQYTYNQTTGGAAARIQSGTDQSMYSAELKDPGSDKSIIYEYDSTGTPSALSSVNAVYWNPGDYQIIECEDTTIRHGLYDASVPSDTETTSTTDATLEGGLAGMVMLSGGSGDKSQFTRFEAGNIGAAGGSIIPQIMHHRRSLTG